MSVSRMNDPPGSSASLRSNLKSAQAAVATKQ